MPFLRCLCLCAAMLLLAAHGARAAGPDCRRPLTLALHEHGLLYSSATGAGIDKDFADELARRSGCTLVVSVLPRARIWRLIESGALDFSLSGIANEQRNGFAAFAWYFSNKYYLLVRKDAQVARLADFEADARLQLGAIRSFRYSRNADRLLERLHQAQRVKYASSLEPLYEVLVRNGIQGMIIEPFDYPQIAGGAVRELSLIVDTGDAAVPHGLIMSRKAIAPAEQEKWQALVAEMRADGTVLRIFEKYFSAEMARSMVNF